MLTYPTAEKAGIDSNLHIGTNRPLAEVTVDGNAIRVISVNGEPMKNGAGQATIVVDNKNGVYAPDKAGAWANVIWPNNIVTISLGYGANREPIFTGLIDTVKMKTFPQTITIQARDTLKRALDQTVTDDLGIRSLTYTDQYLEVILADLAERAGWAVGNIYYDVSGILVSTTFTHETYADAMQRLCEMYNYEYYAGRSGEIYFHYITDRQPEAVDEAVALTGTTPVALAKYPVVTASIRVRSAAAGGGTLYSAATDYIIVAGTKSTAWTIARRVGSTIGSGATVYVSYVWAAWVFEEGKNITGLEYVIDDKDLYAKSYVLGKTNVTDNLLHYPAVASIVVRSAVSGGGTLYTLNTDYAITAGDATTPWKIGRLEGSAIAAGGLVYVSYEYTVGATTYTITDEPHTLYSTTGGSCYGSSDYISTAYYNVLPDKVLIVPDDGELMPSVFAITHSVDCANSYAVFFSSSIFDWMPSIMPCALLTPFVYMSAYLSDSATASSMRA